MPQQTGPFVRRLAHSLRQPLSALLILGAAGIVAAAVVVAVTGGHRSAPAAVVRPPAATPPPPTPPGDSSPSPEAETPDAGAPSSPSAVEEPFAAICAALTRAVPPPASREACHRLAEAQRAYQQGRGRAERSALRGLLDRLEDDDSHGPDPTVTRQLLAAVAALPQAIERPRD